MRSLLLRKRHPNNLNNQQDGLKTGDGGFSLVELLVVVAIMAVVMGLLFATYSIVRKTNVKKAINAIDSAISVCREKAKTNAALEWRVILSADSVIVQKQSDGNVVTEVSKDTLPSGVDYSVVIGGVSYTVTEDASEANAYSQMVFTFKQSGEVGSIYTGDGTTLYPAEDESDLYCLIYARYKDKREYDIKLYYSTGKHVVE